MAVDLAEIRSLLMLAKEAGVRSLKLGDFQVDLYPPASEMQEVDLTKMLDPTQTPATEDEVKYWSAGGSGVVDGNGAPVSPPLMGEDAT
jgi:hypothetical protein